MRNNIHHLAEVQSTDVGEHTNIWQFCIVLKNAKIGSGCNICSHCLVENDVVIGKNVTVKSGVQIWDGITLEDDVFIGPNVTFTNDLFPRSKNQHWIEVRTLVKKGATIGANATVLGGIAIGEYAMVGAGSVVTKSIPAFNLWFGNPAKHTGYVTKDGTVLDLDFVDMKTAQKYQLTDSDITPLK